MSGVSFREIDRLKEKVPSGNKISSPALASINRFCKSFTRVVASKVFAPSGAC